jgi:hypothetical protein
LCGPHYKRKWRYGDPLAGGPFVGEDAARLAALYVVQADGCWLWQGAIDWVGYGEVWWRGKRHRAHRAVYQELRHTLQDGTELDHVCRVKRCVNPDHLEIVTHAENLRRHYAASVVACPKGHLYDEANIYRDHGKRRCRECMREQQRRRRTRNRN